MKNILVFYGGVSCEHDISVITGVMALNALKGTNYSPTPIYIDKNGEWYSGEKLFDTAFYSHFDVKKVKKVTLLPQNTELYEVKNGKLKQILKVDAALNCMHGLNGEDGSLSGLMQLCKIPFAAPPTFASSLAMDKYYTKIVLAGLDVACLPYVRICKDTFLKSRNFVLKYIKGRLGYPVIVKPENLGSSIGISKASNDGEAVTALSEAFRYDGKVVVEKALENFREINCACYKSGDRYFVSECEEPVVSGKFLTFDDKYSTPTEKKFPAPLDKKLSAEIKGIVKYIYKKLDFKGVVRMDFLLIGDKVYLNEINSVPGSLAYYLFCDTTEKLGDFIGVLIEDAIDEFIKFKSNDFTFKSDVLSFGGGIKGGKAGNK